MKYSKFHTFSFKKTHLRMWSGKWWPFCLCLNVLIRSQHWWRWMSWCHQATSRSLRQGWPRSRLPYVINRPQCIYMMDRLTSLPEWISNHRPTKLWEEIIYPFLNFKWISNSISLYYGHDNLSKGPALGDILIKPWVVFLTPLQSPWLPKLYKSEVILFGLRNCISWSNV